MHVRCKKPFHHKKGLQFGCGQCTACRIDRARGWTARILLEARLHNHNAFATLTYNKEHLPPGGTLVRRDTQLFLKRLRKLYPSKTVRYFGVGEYGDESGRPHYHLCLFGVSLFDLEIVAKAWTCPKCKKPIGFVQLDELNEGTAGYVAQYVVKKWTNPHDRFVKPLLAGRYQEFAFMSLRPGIGGDAAPIIAQAIRDKDDQIPSTFRMGGTLRPLGRYVKSRVIKEFPNARDIQEFEKQVWLSKVHEENLQERQEAKEAGKTVELYRWEKRRQRFLNLVNKHKAYKSKRSI